MVNPNSPAHTFSEKIGWIIFQGIQYIVIAGVVYILGRKLGSSSSRPTLILLPSSSTP